MWYPEPRYLGAKGEVNAAFRGAGVPPEVALGPGSWLHYLATGASTNREFGLYRVELAPGGGTTTHFHRTVSEAFYVLSGSLRLHDGSTWIDGREGDFLYVPVGALHGFRNESSQPAYLLNLFMPGADREAYFEGLSGLASLSEEERQRFFTEHDSYFVDPGGGPSTGASAAR
jgi:mannose-6-phosphate isomerase-like protein (cupin superfamily)